MKKAKIKVVGASEKENIEITNNFHQYRKKLHEIVKNVDNRSGIDLTLDLDKIFLMKNEKNGKFK